MLRVLDEIACTILFPIAAPQPPITVRLTCIAAKAPEVVPSSQASLRALKGTCSAPACPHSTYVNDETPLPAGRVSHPLAVLGLGQTHCVWTRRSTQLIMEQVP